MYKCIECRKIFYEPRVVKEIHYECDEHPCEIFVECPYCGGSFYKTDIDTEEQE